MKTIQTLDDLTPDPENANKGTLRGEQLLEKSLSEYGAGRSIVVDQNGVVIGGNKTLQLAIEAGFSARVVKSDGAKLVVVVRTDLDLEQTPQARMLAYLDNRTAELGLSWKPEQLEADLASGISLGAMFTEGEIRSTLKAMQDADVAPTPKQLTSKISFDSAVQLEAWQHALALIEQLPGETFPDKLMAWLDSKASSQAS